MTRNAPRSLDQYLQQLREELAGEDAALVQDALYDAEEYLRAEIAAHPEKSESDVLELIASTYGAPDEVAAAYRDTEVKVKAALKTPVGTARKNAGDQTNAKPGGGFFGVFLDPRAYTSLFFMILSLATGIIYFVVTVVGLSMSIGLGVVIIGVPFFLTFIGLTRIISLAEGRLIEAMTGERMPRRPVHPGPPLGFWARIGNMLRDPRTWSTLAYLLLMLPIGIVYFVIAITGLSISLGLICAPLVDLIGATGWWWAADQVHVSPAWLGTLWALPFVMGAGILLLTALMHLARGVGHLHALFAKALLVQK
jgi:Putative sensor